MRLSLANRREKCWAANKKHSAHEWAKERDRENVNDFFSLWCKNALHVERTYFPCLLCPFEKEWGKNAYNIGHWWFRFRFKRLTSWKQLYDRSISKERKKILYLFTQRSHSHFYVLHTQISYRSCHILRSTHFPYINNGAHSPILCYGVAAGASYALLFFCFFPFFQHKIQRQCSWCHFNVIDFRQCQLHPVCPKLCLSKIHDHIDNNAFFKWHLPGINSIRIHWFRRICIKYLWLIWIKNKNDGTSMWIIWSIYSKFNAFSM